MADSIVPRHEFLTANRSYYELAELSRVGGKAYIDAYLVQHPRERSKTFENRKKAAFYANYVDKVAQIVTSFVMKNVVRTIDGDDKAYREYLDGIDLYNTMDEFVEKKMVEFMLFGNAFARNIFSSNSSAASMFESRNERDEF